MAPGLFRSLPSGVSNVSLFGTYDPLDVHAIVRRAEYVDAQLLIVYRISIGRICHWLAGNTWSDLTVHKEFEFTFLLIAML